MTTQMHMQELAENFYLFTDDPQQFDFNAKQMRLKLQRKRPLVVLFGWLNSKVKHLKKFAAVYVNLGFDALAVQCAPWRVIWPTRGSQPLAANILKFLTNNRGYEQIVLHGFSVGGYIWGETMRLMERDKSRYQVVVLDRICAQVWDSVVGVDQIPIGVSLAMFHKQPTLQKRMEAMLDAFLRDYYDVATVHYRQSNAIKHDTLVLAPALFFLSKTDPVGTEEFVSGIRRAWERKNIAITWKCWDRSDHVAHFRKHRDGYLEALYAHLESVNLIKRPKTLSLKAKL